MGRNQYWAGRVYDLCVNYMTGTPEGSTESGFMEESGIEPATPGLQGIALIHYTTGASMSMSDVVLENTLDIKCIFKQAILLSLFCSGSLYIFFLLLNYQNVATEQILKFVLKNLFWSMRSWMSRILYL